MISKQLIGFVMLKDTTMWVFEKSLRHEFVIVFSRLV